MISVLVVDDSTFMRNTITSLLEQDSEIKVVGTARNGQEALEKAEELDPDVMTLDVDLPRLDGLGVLQQLMKKTPIPVLMVSSLTQSGAESTLKALEYGALDFIPKTMSCDRECFGAELQRKVRAIARRKTIIKLKYRRINQIQVPVPRPQPSQPADYVQTPCTGPRDLVVIGVSTGGPPVVQKILSALPADLPACILIAQHMPAAFTNPFASASTVFARSALPKPRTATNSKQVMRMSALAASIWVFACAARCQKSLLQKNRAMPFTNLRQTCFLKLRAKQWEDAHLA